MMNYEYEGNLVCDLVINDIVIPRNKITSLDKEIITIGSTKWGVEMTVEVMKSLRFKAYTCSFFYEDYRISDISLDGFISDTAEHIIYLQNLKKELERYSIE